MKLVAWFSEVDKDDIGLVGGKGANLGELTKAGIPVPSGFILTANAYFHFLEQSGLRNEIKRHLSQLNVNDSARLQHIAAEIKGLISRAAMPAEVASQIARSYREMDGGPVAVRSSATAEDLAEASFAGQQSTYLNVVGEAEVIQAVQDCWASLFEARAIFYRAQAGFEHLKDVRTGEHDDAMESFFLAETLKYAYLLANPAALDFDAVVFNTEAHPLRPVG